MKRAPLFLSLFFGFLFPFASIAIGTGISVVGNVKERTCNITAGSDNYTVDLLDNASSLFRVVGDSSPQIPFSIILKDCSASVTEVKIGFAGKSDQFNTNLIKLDGIPSSASGIGVEIFDNSHRAIAINTASSRLNPVNITRGGVSIKYYGRMVATKLPVTPGKVNATAIYTLEFE